MNDEINDGFIKSQGFKMQQTGRILLTLIGVDSLLLKLNEQERAALQRDLQAVIDRYRGAEEQQ